MNTRNRARTVLTLVAAVLAALVLVADSTQAAIVVVDSGSTFDGGGTTATISGITASGTDRKLVLAASWENASSAISATWNGTETFTVAENSGFGRNPAILYLDNPTPGTGSVTVTYAASTASRVGVISLTGVADGVDVGSSSTGTSGSLTTTVPDTFVTGVYTTNGSPSITGPFSTTLYNGNSGSSVGNAGYQIEATAGAKNYTWTVVGSADNNGLAGFVPVNESPAPAEGEIAVIRSDSFVDATVDASGRTETLSFDAGDTADKLIVHVSGEGGTISSITYDGVLLLPAITSTSRSKGIFYLDDPFTGGPADLIVTLDPGTNNGLAFGAVSITGSAPGFSAVASDSATSVILNTIVDNSFVLAGYGANGDGTAIPDSPLTRIYGGATGNARGAAGYENLVGVGANSYSFTDALAANSFTLAAAFAPFVAPIVVPEPSTIILAALGLLGLMGSLRRRRDR